MIDPDVVAGDRLLEQLAVGAPGPSGPIPPGVFARVVGRASAESLTPVVVQARDQQRLHLTAPQVEELSTAHHAASTHALRVDAVIADATRLLSQSGVDALVLKGVALAYALYDDPQQRVYGDGDVLIRPGQFADAVGILRAAGAARGHPEFRPGFDERFGKDVELDMGGASIDVHRTLIAGPLSLRLPIASMFDRAQHVEIADVSLSAPCVTHLYLHAALTAGAADVPPRLVTLHDMQSIARHPGFSAREVIEESAEWGVQVALAAALDEIRTLGGTVPDDLASWRSQYRPSRAARWQLWSYAGTARSYRRMLATVVWLPSWRERAALARSLLTPSPDFLRQRGTGRVKFLTSSIRRLVR